MLAVAGGKGGVGKTTTALGLALDLGERYGRCLVADADRDAPDLHVLAGVANRPTVAALVGDAPDDSPDAAERSVAAVARPVPESGTAVLPAAPGVDRGSLRRALRRLACLDRPVVVDCPAGAGPDATDPLRLADECVVVTRTTRAGLRDAAKTAAMARAVGTPVVGAVCSRAASVPDGVGRLFDAPAVAVPRVSDPLRDAAVVRARRRLLAQVTAVGRVGRGDGAASRQRSTRNRPRSPARNARRRR